MNQELELHKQQPPRELLSRRFCFGAASTCEPEFEARIRRTRCYNDGMSEPEVSAGEDEKGLEDFLQQQQNVMRGFLRMTPEEQEEWKQQLHIQGVQTFVSQAGFDEDVARTLITFVSERTEARRGVQALADVLYLCEGTKSELRASDAQLATLLEQYEAALEAERARDRAAAQALDQTLGWSRSPRLKSFLLRTGIVGDALWMAHTDLMSPTGGGASTGIVRDWNEKRTLPPQFAWLLAGQEREA